MRKRRHEEINKRKPKKKVRPQKHVHCSFLEKILKRFCLKFANILRIYISNDEHSTNNNDEDKIGIVQHTRTQTQIQRHRPCITKMKMDRNLHNIKLLFTFAIRENWM